MLAAVVVVKEDEDREAEACKEVDDAIQGRSSLRGAFESSAGPFADDDCPQCPSVSP